MGHRRYDPDPLSILAARKGSLAGNRLMNWNERRPLTRRHILSLFGMTAVALTSAATRARFRFLLNTAADFLYGSFEPPSPVVQSSEHPIQYYVSLPLHHEGGSSSTAPPRALVITIDGSDRDF
jgi:hypothetical protein